MGNITDSDVFQNGPNEYYFEYCSDYFTDAMQQNSLFDNLIMQNSLADPQGRDHIQYFRNYFEILNSNKERIDTLRFDPADEGIPNSTYTADLNSYMNAADLVPSIDPSDISIFRTRYL